MPTCRASFINHNPVSPLLFIKGNIYSPERWPKLTRNICTLLGTSALWESTLPQTTISLERKEVTASATSWNKQYGSSQLLFCLSEQWLGYEGGTPSKKESMLFPLLAKTSQQGCIRNLSFQPPWFKTSFWWGVSTHVSSQRIRDASFTFSDSWLAYYLLSTRRQSIQQHRLSVT